jgi:hypothetical protein
MLFDGQHRQSSGEGGRGVLLAVAKGWVPDSRSDLQCWFVLMYFGRNASDILAFSTSGQSGPRGHVLAAGSVAVTLQVRVPCVITIDINEHEMCVTEVRLSRRFMSLLTYTCTTAT